jgi:hypothetical protein
MKRVTWEVCSEGSDGAWEVVFSFESERAARNFLKGVLREDYFVVHVERVRVERKRVRGRK